MLIMWLVFDLSFSAINVADSMFVVGLCTFFPALIMVTEATKMFDGLSFVRSKMSRKPSFKSIYDYKEHKVQKNLYKKNPGKVLLIISIGYILVSIIISTLRG